MAKGRVKGQRGRSFLAIWTVLFGLTALLAGPLYAQQGLARAIQVQERKGGACGPCTAFEVGQSFDAGWDIPEGFCSFAWADIHKDVKMIQCNGNPVRIRQDHTTISCCKDALCPVVFRIERLDRSMRGEDR